MNRQMLLAATALAGNCVLAVFSFCVFMALVIGTVVILEKSGEKLSKIDGELFAILATAVYGTLLAWLCWSVIKHSWHFFQRLKNIYLHSAHSSVHLLQKFGRIIHFGFSACVLLITMIGSAMASEAGPEWMAEKAKSSKADSFVENSETTKHVLIGTSLIDFIVYFVVFILLLERAVHLVEEHSKSSRQPH